MATNTFRDPGQFGGVPGIEHTPHFLLVATKFSRQLHISHSGRLQPFAPRRFWDLPSAGNPSGDRLLQTIRSLPKRIPLSVSLRDAQCLICAAQTRRLSHSYRTNMSGWQPKSAMSVLSDRL